MEQGQGSNSIDKNKVLNNVRPLRCLVPIFPTPPGISSSSSPQTSPFVCAPPNGPSPPGFNSFYPFYSPFLSQENSEFNTDIPAPTPLSSFKTPPNQNHQNHQNQNHQNRNQNRNRNGEFTNGSTKGTAPKKPRKKNSNFAADIDEVANNFLNSFNLTPFFSGQKPDGDTEIVRYVLMVMNFLRRRITQIESAKETTQRPDLRAGAILMNKGVRTNMTRRVGIVPGVEIGDIFYFRMELCLVGLHAPSMAGIDYLSFKNGQIEEPIAVSIVSSGAYENNSDDTDVIIYSGQGGNINAKNKSLDLEDQKLEKGNLALEKSLHRGNEVRVIRGLEDTMVKRGKIYIYDGLYNIQESWIEKGNSGFNMFKYKLVRIPNQPQGFAIWKKIQQWREGVTPRPGLISSDLASGGENLPISVINEVDDEKGPAYFSYFPNIKYSRPLNLPRPSSCSCSSGCKMSDPNCPCSERNGGTLLTNVLGVNLSFKSILYECGSSCSCPATCRNRVSQSGLKLRLEVFKTRDKGWGLRSLDPIRSGAYVCEYAGEIIDKSILRNNDENFIFDASRRFEPREIMIDGSDEPSKLPFPLVISAKNIGNVARFMNHSCSPNLYWQPVMREKDNESYLHIVFFAINNIAPMRELMFDYGMIRFGDVELRRKKCLCRSLNCRGYFY